MVDTRGGGGGGGGGGGVGAQLFIIPVSYFILEAMKYWRWERPGNKASSQQ